MKPILASFKNAWRIATTMADHDQEDYAVLKTQDSARPYVVEKYEGQPGAIALITSDQHTALRWINTAAQARPITAKP